MEHQGKEQTKVSGQVSINGDIISSIILPLGRKTNQKLWKSCQQQKVGRHQCLHGVVLGCTRKAAYHVESLTKSSNLTPSLLLEQPFPQLKGWQSHDAFFFPQQTPRFSILDAKLVHLIRIREVLSWADSFISSLAKHEKHQSKNGTKENQVVWGESPWTGNSCGFLKPLSSRTEKRAANAICLIYVFYHSSS